MTDRPPPPLRAALLDLYDGEENLGIAAIERALSSFAAPDGRRVETHRYEVRNKDEVPAVDAYDLFVSSGGPGSPFDGEGTRWETRYFRWLEALWDHDQHPSRPARPALFICHSYQMMARFFGWGDVTERRSTSFGIFPVHPTAAGRTDPLLGGLPDPFYAADFRSWQVVRPDHARLDALGAEVLALEKERPHVPLERATMAVRLSPALVGVQFHPEADPDGMQHHFRRPERQRGIVDEHGEAKYARIMRRVRDPNFLARTHDHVIPTFLRRAASELSADSPQPSATRAETLPAEH